MLIIPAVMSDHWIGIIPLDPYYIPIPPAIDGAEAYMAEIASEAEEIPSRVYKKAHFHDCGENCKPSTVRVATWKSRWIDGWNKWAIRTIGTMASILIL